MKLMRKYRVFVCAVLILCFFSFQISRPRQALAIAPAVSLAAAAVLAVGAAAGLSYTFENADAESIAGRLQAFLDDVHPGTSIATYFSARGAAVKDGLMYIGQSLYTRILEFLNWEIGDTGLTAGSSVVVSTLDFNIRNLDGSTVYITERPKNTSSRVSSLGTYWVLTDDFDLTVKFSELCLYRITFDGSVFELTTSVDGGVNWSLLTNSVANHPDTAYQSSPGNVWLTFSTYNASASPVGWYPTLWYIQSDDLNSSGQMHIISMYNVYPFGNQVSTLPSSLSLTASDVISFPEVLDGQSVCVDVGMLTGSTIDDVADEIIDAAIDGTLSSSISAETWTVDVVATPQELAQDLDTDLTTEVEDNPTVPDSETIEFDTPSHYSVRDLRQFFPFCIPFDLFDMLGVLAAQPVAPHFEYRFQPGIANIDCTIVIDFQQFDSVALLLRRLETLSFCIGLAMVTRNLIRG